MQHFRTCLQLHIWCVSFLARVNSVVMVRLAGGCRIWDTRTSRCLHTTKLSRDILHAAWRPDGAEIAVLDRTDTLTVIDSSTFKVTRAFKYQTESNEIAFSADGTLIYIATVNGAIDVSTIPLLI